MRLALAFILTGLVVWVPGDACAFMSTPNGELLELQEAAPQDAAPCSWFVDQTVQKDGTLFLASRVDPLFFALPHLEKNEGRFSPLGQLVPAVLEQACPSLASRAHMICEVNGGSSVASPVCNGGQASSAYMAGR